MKFHIECDSIEELNSVADYLSKNKTAPKAKKGEQGAPFDEPLVNTPTAPAQVFTTAVGEAAAAATAIAAQTAVATAAAMAAQTAPIVPTTQPPAETFTFEEVANYAVRVMEVRNDVLMSVLGEFGVQALTAIPQQNYGFFVARLRELSGVQI